MILLDEHFIVPVYGEPAPQGSKKAFVRGNRAVLVDDSKKTKPWKRAVREACEDAIESWKEQHRYTFVPIDEAIECHMVFFMPRPKSLAKKVKWCFRKPDLDKLLRATFDGVTESQLWKDDARVRKVVAEKNYEDAEHEQGAILTIRTIRNKGTQQ